MDGDAKLRYFEMLLRLGYKEIEVSYPSASQTEFDFTRRLITTGAIPEDVTIQVMAPCREDLILTTIEAVRGAKKIIVHIHMSTSACFREVVFKKSKGEMLARAVRCAQLVREATRLSPGAETRQTEWTLEFTPENFQDTSLDFALEICEAAKAVWRPTRDNPIIFNLAATVEGCLFGNGERTGNVDLVTLGMNLYTQDLGREHQAIIRINAQSGKGGIGWLAKNVLGGVELPRGLEIAFTRVVKSHADATGGEITHAVLEGLFQREYMSLGASQIATVRCDHTMEDSSVQVDAAVAVGGVQHHLRGAGPDLISSIVQAVQRSTLTETGFSTRHHSIQKQQGQEEDKHAVFVELGEVDAHGCWGVGMHDSVAWASLAAVSLQLSINFGTLCIDLTVIQVLCAVGKAQNDSSRATTPHSTSPGSGKGSDDQWTCVCSLGCDGA
ncbi:hypothetical protein KVR01_011935 [Diaporthe batatas]|uniref:uncharacterized protein n=1 Tax=Diaporthe batatas TaxID=748121 RepID=UPI001D05207F|nr:uncharacterized protein KVR01_011935 [Diaporthe batatas]KAG8158174.1 hypothetical protein KVR01_011935 [Diaporthe batatas]